MELLALDGTLTSTIDRWEETGNHVMTRWEKLGLVCCHKTFTETQNLLTNGQKIRRGDEFFLAIFARGDHFSSLIYLIHFAHIQGDLSKIILLEILDTFIRICTIFSEFQPWVSVRLLSTFAETFSECPH